MRRYTDIRYIPYLRTRNKAHVRWNAPAGASIRGILVFIRMVLLFVFSIYALGSMGDNFMSAVKNISEYETALLVSEYIDQGILQTTDLRLGESFISVEYNKSGKVTAVETNTIAINCFAAELSEKIHSEIKQRENIKIKAPLGVVTGNGLLSALGFSIPYRVIPAGKVTVTPKSSFESGGINQTIHRLNMEVCVQVKVLFPLIDKEEEIRRDILISETVILGDVPNMVLSQGLFD